MPMPMPTAATGNELMFMSMPSQYITASDIGCATSEGSMTMSAPVTDQYVRYERMNTTVRINARLIRYDHSTSSLTAARMPSRPPASRKRTLSSGLATEAMYSLACAIEFLIVSWL